jgi:DNA-directed RNA polymerase alpha subunit
MLAFKQFALRTVNSNSSTAVNNCGSKSSEVGKVSSSLTNSNSTNEDNWSCKIVDVSVFNKDKVIATVNAGGHMRLTLKISTGIGYDAAVARDDEATTIGGMQLDASFSQLSNSLHYEPLIPTHQLLLIIAGQNHLKLAGSLLL